MTIVRSPKELETRLTAIYRASQTATPSRSKLASQLMQLAEDVSSASHGPYIEGPEPSESEIRRMLRQARSGGEATWAKLRDGSWGVKLTGRASAGDSVVVRKKSGQTSTVTLGRLIWSNNSDAWLFTVGSSGSGSSRSRSRGTWTGCSCGSVEEYEKDSDCADCRRDR